MYFKLYKLIWSGEGGGESDTKFSTAETFPINHMIYVPSLDGNLYALDVNSGKKEWELETQGAIVGSPTIVSDMLVVGSTDGELRIVEIGSGELLGSCDIGESIESSITSEGSDVYFSVRDHSVRSIVVKPNGNPDEKWDAPYFSNLLKDDKNPQPSDWSPDC